MVSKILSAGCLSEIMGGFYFDKPVLQVLGSKRIGTEGNIRYRLVVSDGKHFTSRTVLSKILTSYVEDKKLPDKTIIRVQQYTDIYIPQGNAIVIMELKVLHPGVEVKAVIGDPEILIGEDEQEIPTIYSLSLNQQRNGSFSSYNKASDSDNFELCKPKERINSRIIYPIKELQAFQKKGTIKATVVSKTFIRLLSGYKGLVKAFDMHLMDDTGEIIATCSGNAVDKFYEMIEVDKIYLMSKYLIHEIDKSSGDCEVILQSETILEEWLDDNKVVPSVKYNLVPLFHIQNMVVRSTVDIIGICHDVGDRSKIHSKVSGTEICRRQITLVDATLATTTVTLWGENAENFNGDSQPVILITDGRISDFGGRKSVSLPTFGSMKLNPDIYEAHQLRRWYDSEN